jgi:N-acetylglucosamine malate deacetylase 2
MSHPLLAPVFFLSLVALGPLVSSTAAQQDDMLHPGGDELNVLVVTAHPDDETLMAGTIYKLTNDLGANVDLALVTDGSGGFHYAMIGEAFYGLEIDTEEAARQNLPAIRKQELMGSGRILGIREFFFIDAFDHEYTTDVDTVLQHVWDVETLRDSLRAIMHRVRYDFVLGLLPTEETHGHHKGATILALEVASEIPAAERPVVLGAEEERVPFTGLDRYPITRVDPAAPVFQFDRLQPMEEDRVINYHLIVNWALAEHKSQGDLASYFSGADSEYYWFFAANDAEKVDEAAALFARLDENPWR